MRSVEDKLYSEGLDEGFKIGVELAKNKISSWIMSDMHCTYCDDYYKPQCIRGECKYAGCADAIDNMVSAIKIEGCGVG